MELPKEITVDSAAGAAYILLASEKEATTTISVAHDVLIDVDKDGALVGIELLNPPSTWLTTSSERE